MTFTYQLFRQRAYPSKLLICSLRLGPQVDGVMRCWHVEETAGGQTIFTLPPPFLTELFTQADHLTFERRIRNELPVDVMARLRNVAYFTTAYEPDGLEPQDFNQIPALLNTMKEFRAAMDKIVTFTTEAMRASQPDATPA